MEPASAGLTRCRCGREFRNTPTVARASYVDPLALERFESGRTIVAALRRLGGTDLTDDSQQAAVERAVVRLIRSS